MNWFQESRFGLFIHFGLYALPARHEWIKNYEQMTHAHYQRYFERFNPDLLDAGEWAEMAVHAGMKYVVLTTKHHDGFCLWDSQLTDYKITNTPYGKDIIALYVEALRERGLKVGFYHSLIDWHHPHFTVDGLHPQRNDKEARASNINRDMEIYREYLHGQVRELLTTYGQIDVMWFDFSYAYHDWGWSNGKGKYDWGSEILVQMVRDLQPGILINNRTELPGDFATPEQYQPYKTAFDDDDRMWEVCHTMNGSWGYHRDNFNWKSTEMLLHILIESVSMNGNFLLNVGPTGRGEFEPAAQQRLTEIGQWIRQHGRAIYNCGSSKYEAPQGCYYTQNGNMLYLHLVQYPFKQIHLQGLDKPVHYAQFLHDASEIYFEPYAHFDPHLTGHVGDESIITMKLPAVKPDLPVTVIEIELGK